MKQLIITLAILLLGTGVVYAEDIQAIQTTDVDCSGIAVVINKQPENTAIKQEVKIRRSGLIFVININGKVEVPEKEGK